MALRIKALTCSNWTARCGQKSPALPGAALGGLVVPCQLHPISRKQVPEAAVVLKPFLYLPGVRGKVAEHMGAGLGFAWGTSDGISSWLGELEPSGTWFS